MTPCKVKRTRKPRRRYFTAHDLQVLARIQSGAGYYLLALVEFRPSRTRPNVKRRRHGK